MVLQPRFQCGHPIVSKALLWCFKIQRTACGEKCIGSSLQFDHETIEIETHKPEVDAHASYRYTGILKGYERKDAFYLFVDKRRAFLVSKNGFTEGSAEELRMLLINKLGKKFRI